MCSGRRLCFTFNLYLPFATLSSYSASRQISCFGGEGIRGIGDPEVTPELRRKAMMDDLERDDRILSIRTRTFLLIEFKPKTRMPLPVYVSWLTKPKDV